MRKGRVPFFALNAFPLQASFSVFSQGIPFPLRQSSPSPPPQPPGPAPMPGREHSNSSYF